MVEMAPGTALASVGLLLLLSRGPFAHAGENLRETTTKPCLSYLGISWLIYIRWLPGPVTLPIWVSVESDLSNVKAEFYSSSVMEGGVLLGALRRLQETEMDFK